ncbi:serine protease 7-like [Anoplophora glabripennis]|uniref:serine protease 7-like n=1 Tax=Anoplophora glabripennis TaxID=217634 RepID=UPI00087420D1|nr:serine protease 7-like [Anoplophora glabripennis]
MCQFRNLFAFNSVLCYLVLFSVTGYAQWLVDDEGCRTPDGGAGNCIKIKECKPIVDFLQAAPSPIPEEVRIVLNKYICGYDETFKVCCPSKPIRINLQLNDLSLQNPPPPPDVSNHKNFKLLPEECGYLDSPNKIRNGKDANLNEFPWMALLSYKTSSGPQFQCGGAIVNDRYILTAAHCITNLMSPLLGVRVGEHKISSKVDCEVQDDGNEVCSPLPVQDLAIEEVIVHPGYDKEVISNDIGLLRVSKMNSDAENVRPVCLPITEDTRNARISYCVVTGWGFTDTGRNADVLQKVDLPIMNLTSCSEVYKSEKKVKLSYKQICAGGKNKKDSCPGDSGGPMQVAAAVNGEPRYVQQGIVSFGHRFCGTEGYPGVYTRVAYYMDWILDNMKP